MYSLSTHFDPRSRLRSLVVMLQFAVVLFCGLLWSLDTPLLAAPDALAPPSRVSLASQTVCSTVTQIPSSECEVLLTLFNSTGGPTWINRNRWLVDQFPCQWQGVTCANGHVTAIYLPNNNLSGTIPSALATLPQLVHLNLALNQLSGAIPTTFTQLANLQVFDLAYNYLNGGTLLAEFAKLPNLEILNLSGCQLQGEIPAQWQSALTLQSLSFADNQLTGTLPATIGNLTQLSYFAAPRNQLQGAIPPELGNLTKLAILYLDGNQFTGAIPSELSRLLALQELHLGNNRLSGAIPTWLGNFTNLRVLGLAGNRFYGSIPQELSGASQLTYLALDRNYLGGALPASFANLTKLKDLYLNRNELSGAIPPWIGGLPQLHALDLAVNQFVGVIPPELGNLANLEYLKLSINNLQGAIPAELGRLQKLKLLDLAYNHLTGTLPSELAQLPNLEHLNLSGWESSDGILPVWLSQLKQLLFLSIADSHLQSRIPPELGSLPKLEHLTLVRNRLQGPIPTELGGPDKPLQHLDLNHNVLQGAIPESLADLSKLRHLDLSYNQLTAIPEKLKERCRPIYCNFIENPIADLPPLPISPALVLIYAVLDNDLGENWTALINRAERGVHAGVNVRMMIDGPGNNNSAIYDLKHDEDDLCPSVSDPLCGYSNGTDWQSYPESVATLEALEQFLNDALHDYPNASPVVLALVGHGGGWSANALPGQPSPYKDQDMGGLLWDDNPGSGPGSQSLSTQALGQALYRAFGVNRRAIDLLYLDACSMLMAEVAYEVRNSSHYLLGSPNTDWATFVYDQLIAVVTPTISGAEIGQKWLEIEAQRLRRHAGHPFMLSLLNLKQMDELRLAVNTLGNTLRAALPTQKQAIMQAFRNAARYESDYNGKLEDKDAYTDLYSFADQLRQQFGGQSEILRAAQDVMQIVSTAVISKDVQDGNPWLYPASYWHWADSGGISVYLPLQQDEDRRQLLYHPTYLAWAQDNAWSEFLNTYWQGATNLQDAVAAGENRLNAMPRCFATTQAECSGLSRPLPLQEPPLPEKAYLPFTSL